MVTVRLEKYARYQALYTGFSELYESYAAEENEVERVNLYNRLQFARKMLELAGEEVWEELAENIATFRNDKGLVH